MEKPPQSDFSAAPANTPRADAELRHPLDWPAARGTGAVDDVLAELEVRLVRRRQRLRRRYSGVVVAAMLVGCAGWMALRTPRIDESNLSSSAVVSVPERRLLSDGSVVELRYDAQVTVDFNAVQRRVVLERGEAHFEVRKDPTRPFVVAAGAVEFRAVGTAFAVSYSDREVEMVVTSGRVAVETRTAPESPTSGDLKSNEPVASVEAEPLVVEARTRVIVDVTRPGPGARSVSQVSELDLNRRLAWRAPKLEFSGTPLGQAITMIHQQAPEGSKTRLVLGEPSLAAVRISGILRADNIDVLLGLLEEDHGIRAERRAGEEIVLQRAR